MARFVRAKPSSLIRGKSRSGLYGEWVLLERKLREVARAKFLDELKPEFRALGESVKKKAQRRIDSQAGGWASLAASTIRKKGHGTIFIDSGFYRDHIKVKFERTTQRTVSIMIFPEDISHPGSGRAGDPGGQSLQKIAAGLEFGKSNQPARPLWRPILAEVPTSRAFKTFIKKVGEKMTGVR